ncbi:hypothetical protein GY21_00810 [Cryobacterium roopkundense]|uniref:Type II secretory pathway pseudopilin PulG n=1 Tax=Cryobacterium roopkundense TaxID=1001240 RepID=A0A099JY76_9MICO|nr:type II secretion system protein [Cryobacterium roopkundense]KGJ82343.1 hypothetical protein GY21_00810 [Cryobacterium roopkundense]MBB5639505.1 type II secretory pathway pseudopilin PulG [Cryobacterium roopkundense]
MNVLPENAARRAEVGFGLIEVAVSMFLLGLLAVAFLPFLVQGIQQSSANGTLATATQLVNREIENARAQATCTNLSTSLSPALVPVGEAEGVDLHVTRTGGTCPAAAAAYPTTVLVEVKVERADTGAELARATTLIFVEAK